MRPQDAALRTAALSALRDLIDVAVTESREETLHALGRLAEEMGAEQIKVRLADGSHVATVSLTVPKAGIYVDPAGMLAYCKAHHPGEVVEAVNEPFRRALVERLDFLDDGTIADPKTGQVVDFASVRPPGRPSMRLTFTTGEDPGRAQLARAWRSGDLANVVPTELGGKP